WIGTWAVLPALALETGSLVVHPMMNLRYVGPGLAALAIFAAGLLGNYRPKVRNLVATGFALACLILLPFDYPRPQPWQNFARNLEANHQHNAPVFFESGFIFPGSEVAAPNEGFPSGYYSVPFNYYFHGANPRIVVPGFDPAAARSTIESRVAAVGAGWLISWKNRSAIQSELPNSSRFKSAEYFRREDLAIYRITPIATSGK
ncbi:MAG TPA: hypothetical protein VMT58_08480, partial [Candidatus Binataceae bacterium]|nr:hypothetical protein [Candidatus Binataceae bacterium]